MCDCQSDEIGQVLDPCTLISFLVLVWIVSVGLVDWVVVVMVFVWFLRQTMLSSTELDL